MIELVILVLLTSVLMFGQDTFASGLTVAEARNLRRWPGALDAAGDFVSRYGSAITAASVVKWGLGTWQTAVIVCATAITSYYATNFATPLAHRLLPKGHDT